MQMNWFKKMVAAVLVAGTLCAPVTVYAADDTTAITATAETQSTSMYVNKKCYSYDSPNAGHKQLELIYSGTKVTVVGEKGQYYKLNNGSYVMKKYLGKTCTNWTTFKYKTAKTMYAANNVVTRQKALSNGAKAGSVKSGQKLTVIGYTNTGYSKLTDGSYILTKYVNPSATTWKYFKYNTPVTMYATKSVIIRSKALSNAPRTGSVKADQKLTVVGYTNTGFYRLDNGKYIKTSYAAELEANPTSDFKYKIDNNEVTITEYVGTDTTLVIPSEIDGKPVTGIGPWPFPLNSSLTSIVIPDSLTNIRDGAFINCTSLTKFMVSGENGIYKTVDGALLSKDGTVLVLCPGSVTKYTIPDSVTSIGAYAFASCDSLSSIVIPDNVKSIGDYAFAGCESLSSIVIPNSVKSIGDYAFSNCSKLTSIVIPNGVKNIVHCTFYDCSNLTSVVIPDSVRNIEYYAFSNCSSLTSLVIPDGVRSIEWSAFDDCPKLTVTYKGKTYNKNNMNYLYSLF